MYIIYMHHIHHVPLECTYFARCLMPVIAHKPCISTPARQTREQLSTPGGDDLRGTGQSWHGGSHPRSAACWTMRLRPNQAWLQCILYWVRQQQASIVRTVNHQVLIAGLLKAGGDHQVRCCLYEILINCAAGSHSEGVSPISGIKNWAWDTSELTVATICVPGSSE